MGEENTQLMISVIMGVYNCEETVSQSIESVLNQTFQNFEFIICDDGSSDKTFEIVNKYAKLYPNKIVVISNGKNMGLNYTLNHCLKYAKGKYIARMDGDDESLPNRFEQEIKYLETHPKISILGATLKVFDDEGIWGIHQFDQFPMPKDFIKGSPFSHSVCMVRKEAYDAVGGYSEGKYLMRVEDYHLWIKMYTKGYLGANLSDKLYLYRDDRNAYNKRKFKYRINESYVTMIAIKKLKLSFINYIYVVKPLLVGLMPYKLYDYLHKKKLHSDCDFTKE